MIKKSVQIVQENNVITASPASSTPITTKYSTALFLTLIIAGLAGNYFNYPIFLNINFLFGSIFAMLALQFFGLGRGIVAAVAIASYTYVLWNHPYAIIIMTAEVAVVGWLIDRRKLGLVLADTLYWLIIGMPLVYLFYHVFMHIPSTNIVMTKQAVNGIANALFARLIFTGYAHSSRTLLISYREIVYNLLTFFVLVPALITLTVSSRTDFNETDLRIRASLIQESQRVDQRLEGWLKNRESAIVNLAEIAALRSPQQMQPFLELVKKSDSNFQRVGLLNKQATTTAFCPLIDELGQSNIGKNFADRPFIAVLKQTLKPMLSEVYMGRIGAPKPVVAMVAPVVIAGEYGGYVIGVLGLDQIREYLDKNTSEIASRYTLLDKNGIVIMTNRADQTVMTPFAHGKGMLTRLDKGISQWIPALPHNIPISERWKNSYYVAESSLGSFAEWQLILEQPIAPFQKTLFDHYSSYFNMLSLILLLALTLAEFLSRKIVVTLGQLRTLTHELPIKLATDCKEIDWPESGIKEANHLINNFRQMANTLSEQFTETRQINESLEQRVEERTAELCESEQALRSSEEQMLLAQQIGHAGSWAYNIETNKIWGSAEALRLFGFNPVAGYFPIEDIEACIPKRERVHQALVALITAGREYNIEYVINPADGSSPKVIHSIARLEMDAQGNQLKVLGFIQDITDRKRAEEALRKSEALYHSLVETSQDLIWQCDSEGRYTFLNLAWEQVFGYELDEMIGKKFSDFQTPENAARDMRAFSRLIQGDYVDRYESTHIGKSGNEIHLVFNALFMSDSNGNIVGASGTAYDITQRKLMEEELRHAKVAAEAANIAKSRFLATMSHEIRTPMNGVIGMIELLQHTELTPEQNEFTESAKQSGIELVCLLNDILDLSKIEADKIELESTNFELQPVISDTVNLLTLSAREKGVTLTSLIDTDVPSALKGDAGRLRQIIINLVGNAIKFTPKGVVTLHIRKDNEDENYVTLRFLVRDSGIGIAADKLEHVFEPFTQADSSTTRTYGGTGLGLAICKRLSELMGGNIGAESEEGHGSTFWFTVVMEKRRVSPLQEEEFIAVSPSGGGVVRRDPSANGIRILLTEDDPRAQKIVPKLLNNYGYLVDVAGDGKAALQALEKNDYELVLMDCMMPEMNGYEVTAVIRDMTSAVRRHDIPVIALTGNAMKQDRDMCIAAGMDDHLPKPLILDDLLVKLDEWLKDR